MVMCIMIRNQAQRGLKMLEREFTSTQLQREASRGYDAVKVEPVLITRVIGDSMILMSKADYLKLLKNK